VACEDCAPLGPSETITEECENENLKPALYSRISREDARFAIGIVNLGTAGSKSVLANMVTLPRGWIKVVEMKLSENSGMLRRACCLVPASLGLHSSLTEIKDLSASELVGVHKSV
jgi:hypothetical protein